MLIRLAMNFRNAGFSAAAAAALLPALSGCFSSTPKQDWANLIEKSKTEAGKKGTPKFDVVGQSLGEGQEVSLTSEELLARVQASVSEGRMVAAARWIERHPETALEWLRSGTSGDGMKAAKDDAVAGLMAQVHDRQCTTPGPQSWTSLLTARGQDPESYQAYLDARNRFKNALAQGQVDQAHRQELSKLAAVCNSQMLEIDALQLQATAHLLNDKPKEAAAGFSKAAAIAAPISPYQTAYLLLLLSDAQRRAGDPATAAATWERAVVTASQLLAAEYPVHDPVLWEKLGYQRPVESPWPGDVVAMLQHLEPLPGMDAGDELPEAKAAGAGADPNEAEISIWNAIGVWYLDRGHAQASLVSFKRAESSAKHDVVKNWLRLRQARSLVQLQQEGAATAILVRAAGEKTTPVARAAMGMLGSLRLKSGQVPQGYALLRKSVEKADGIDWPERADAEVDLGLACLMMGDEKQGLQRLHAAQELFERQGNWESLTLALSNEAAYLDETKQKKEAAAVRARLASLEGS